MCCVCAQRTVLSNSGHLPCSFLKLLSFLENIQERASTWDIYLGATIGSALTLAIVTGKLNQNDILDKVTSLFLHGSDSYRR